MQKHWLLNQQFLKKNGSWCYNSRIQDSFQYLLFLIFSSIYLFLLYPANFDLCSFSIIKVTFASLLQRQWRKSTEFSRKAPIEIQIQVWRIPLWIRHFTFIEGTLKSLYSPFNIPQATSIQPKSFQLDQN